MKRCSNRTAYSGVEGKVLTVPALQIAHISSYFVINQAENERLSVTPKFLFIYPVILNHGFSFSDEPCANAQFMSYLSSWLSFMKVRSKLSDVPIKSLYELYSYPSIAT